jgi:predicted permease
VAADLKENMATGRGESGAGRLRGGKLLVAVQVALSLPLVIDAGLFLRTLGNLEHQTLGFDPDRILLFKIDPTKAGFKDAGLLRAYEEIEDRVRSLPGVRGVSASRLGLITGWVNNGTMALDDQDANLNPRTCRAHWNQVTPGFFETMGMPLLLGRRLDARDGADSLDVAVVNETMARQIAPAGNPIGRRFWYNRTRKGKPVEIVGVVRDAKYASLRAPAPPTAYVPHTQSRTPLAAMVFQVRTTGDPMALVGGIRQVATEVVPGVPIGDVKTQARQIEDSLGQETMYVRLFSFFGVVALLLACIGLYGTMAYALGRRTREIGIRMALGAARGRVLRMALAESAVVAVVGVVAGVLLATAGSRYIRSLLFEIDPMDVPTLATGVLVMFVVAMAAGYVPARRASRLDPLRALREE